MPYVPFHDYFPEIAERETRTIIVMEDPSEGLPREHYSLLELYCDEPGCDCRRVFFMVLSPRSKRPHAVIAYGWESRDFYARWIGHDDPETLDELQGPVLNLTSPQSDLAPALLDLVENLVLRDEAYVERLKAHYRMFRERIDGKRPVRSRRKEKKEKKKEKKKQKKRRRRRRKT